ncbi:MAG: peptidoglycan-associated lipoprotein Pal [bacterium]|nr:peptidoglycan-associated lipoprotein Pal [bacterium]
MIQRSRRNRLIRHALVALFGLALAVGPVGCGISPKERQHWWQFWRTKPDKTGIYKPDTITLPPAPDASGLGGASSALPAPGQLPPPPVPGTLAEPGALRQAPQGAVAELRTVYFDFDSADLTGEAQQTLDADAAWMLAHPDYQYQIEGHTDERGTVEYNLNLGDRRAKAVREYLVSRGVPADKLHTISYGEERPIDPASSEEAWAKNRRVQFLVY